MTDIFGEIDPSEKPVFIVGLGRSGTSLTRSLINGHQTFAIAPEIHFLDHWMPRFRRVDIGRDFDKFWEPFVAGKHFRRLQIDSAEARTAILANGSPTWRDVYRTLLAHHAAALERPRWGEKTPVYFRHISQLLRWFPKACIVYLIRDPRGVAGSHQVVGTEWADLDPDHVAKAWLESVHILKAWARDPRIQPFRYEDIVSVPHETLPKLFHFLGDEFDPALLETRDSPLENGPATGPLSARSAVSANPVYKWQERLSPTQVSIIEHTAGKSMRPYGYEEVGAPLAFRTLTELSIHRTRRNLRRIAHALSEPREALYRLYRRLRRRLGR